MGETINLYIGDTKVRVRMLAFSCGQVRVGIDAPQEVAIVRAEIDERESEDNEQ
jgi:carbon storage regulator CsrA